MPLEMTLEIRGEVITDEGARVSFIQFQMIFRPSVVENLAFCVTAVAWVGGMGEGRGGVLYLSHPD